MPILSATAMATAICDDGDRHVRVALGAARRFGGLVAADGLIDKGVRSPPI